MYNNMSLKKRRKVMIDVTRKECFRINPVL